MIAFIRQLGKDVEIRTDELVVSGKLNTDPDQIYSFTLTQCISELVTYTTLAVLQHTKLRFKDLNKSTIVRGL